MRVHGPEIRELEGTREVSAWIDDFRLWYRAPESQPLAISGDAFAAAALLPAMAKGEPLVVEPPLTLSPRLLENLKVFQEIHHRWNPALRIVPVRADARPAVRVDEGTLCFFSGGVDSLFTFLKRAGEIDRVVYIQGFDFPVDDADFKAALARNAAFVGHFGKTIIPVTTNSNDFGYHHNLSMLLTQGSVLASVAHLIGFRRALVSAAYPYNRLAPLGSHPLTDPLWSSDAVEIAHEGAEARRVDKIARIARDPAALTCLQVCARSVACNCGQCYKCLRTMIPLAVIGAPTPTFPPLPPFSKIRRMRVPSEIESYFIRENFVFAVERNARALSKALGAGLKRYDRRRLLRDADQILLGGVIKRAFRRLSKKTPVVRRISMVPPKD